VDNIRSLWAFVRSSLIAVNIDELEAEILIRFVTNMSRTDFYTNLDYPINSSIKDRVSYYLEKRLSGEPLSYITEEREFYGLNFRVNPNVLIPRSETEDLVELAIRILQQKYQTNSLVADIGTGTGAIAVSIATFCTQITVFATDISSSALQIAKHNITSHNLQDRIFLKCGDLLNAIPSKVDLIIANLPYLTKSDLDKVSIEVKKEPRVALDGGMDGLDLILNTILQSQDYLKPNGCLILEIAPNQIQKVSKYISEIYDTAEIIPISDSNQIIRGVSVFI
tara:strand:+ start:3803 stop:4645 length:843 start_codon:yes stop_codon:yes gene_type:complete